MTHTAPRRDTNANGFKESARGGIHNEHRDSNRKGGA
jgi:hypothetical protein